MESLNKEDTKFLNELIPHTNILTTSLIKNIMKTLIIQNPKCSNKLKKILCDN
jgi:hypothetical protein